MFSIFFFFNDTATTEIYTLSLHDALPISPNPSTGSSSSPSFRRGSITLDHQVVRGFAVGRCAAVDVHAEPSGGSAVPQLDPSALLNELRDVAAQLGSSGAQRRHLGV